MIVAIRLLGHHSASQSQRVGFSRFADRYSQFGPRGSAGKAGRIRGWAGTTLAGEHANKRSYRADLDSMEYNASASKKQASMFTNAKKSQKHYIHSTDVRDRQLALNIREGEKPL